MSTSTCYNLITSSVKNQSIQQASSPPIRPIDERRQATLSPSCSSMATSSSNSSSSLNQFNSLTIQHTASSTADSSSSSSSASSTTSNHSNHSLIHFHYNRNQNHQNSTRHSSITPIGSPSFELLQLQQPHRPGQQQTTFHSYTLQSLEPKPLKPFKSSSQYLDAMREDLAEWFNRLYPDLDLTAENFFSQLETGCIICRHANSVTKMGRNLLLEQTTSNSSSSSFDSTNHAYDDSNCTSTAASPPNTDLAPSLIANNFIAHHSLLASPFQSLSLNNNNNSLSSLKLDSRSLNINWFQIKLIPYKQDAQPATFLARDNICQFILWCRSLNILECLLFETDDLVARKNEKNFILCLLEVARIGFKVGMPTPLIIQLEHEIDREIENEARLQRELHLAEEEAFKDKKEKKNQDDVTTIDSYITNEDSFNQHSTEDCDKQEVDHQEEVKLEGTIEETSQKTRLNEEKSVKEDEQDYGPKPQVITNDLLSLHERVVQLLCLCTCPTQFPMVRVGENGKYKVGDKLIIFVRILRRHIMVRVGGGWQELSEFLRVKDPCRSKSPPGITIQNQSNLLHQPAKLALNSRSRLVESSQQLNKGYHNYRNASVSGQRLISGSASMGWLSHNS